MFSLICIWINDWVNNGEAGDLRRCPAHYDVIVMLNTLRPEWRPTLCTRHFEMSPVQWNILYFDSSFIKGCLQWGPINKTSTLTLVNGMVPSGRFLDQFTVIVSKIPTFHITYCGDCPRNSIILMHERLTVLCMGYRGHNISLEYKVMLLLRNYVLAYRHCFETLYFHMMF